MADHTTRTTLTRIRHENMSTFVPAERTPQPPIHVAPLNIIDVLPTAVQSHHTRQDDDALSQAKATLLVSVAYIIAAAMITVGLLLFVWIFKVLGDAVALYFYTGLIFWGVCILVVLLMNRRQSLHHSSTGLGHAEINSRERLAKHAIDQHVRLLLARWKVEDENRGR